MKRYLKKSPLRAVLGITALLIVVLAARDTRAKDSTWGKITDPAQRFQSLANFNNEAILDKETGLIWENCPTPENVPWVSAINGCYEKWVGDRKGWRLPTVEELMSLGKVPPNVGPPYFLPNSGPFCTNAVQIDSMINRYYWTYTTYPDDSTKAYYIEGQGGALRWDLKTRNLMSAWCVRGGPAHDSGR